MVEVTAGGGDKNHPPFSFRQLEKKASEDCTNSPMCFAPRRRPHHTFFVFMAISLVCVLRGVGGGVYIPLPSCLYECSVGVRKLVSAGWDGGMGCSEVRGCSPMSTLLLMSLRHLSQPISTFSIRLLVGIRLPS